eukprot:346026-Ditylum_brightwellii.AAC.1
MGTHHLDLHIKAHHKAVQKKQILKDDEFNPCSACIEFTLTVSKDTEKNQEFRDLSEAINKIIADCRK